MTTLRSAAARAQRWLATTASSTDVTSLRQLGLWLCDQIRSPGDSLVEMAEGPVSMPAPTSLVNMDRSELLALAQTVSLSEAGAWPAGPAERRNWAQILGAMALSYARTGDVAVVAALVRMAAHLGLHGSWLREAHTYLVDQQQEDGSFGLLAQELALLGNKAPAQEAVLRLTVEVLWTLAEVARAEQEIRFCSSSSLHLC